MRAGPSFPTVLAWVALAASGASALDFEWVEIAASGNPPDAQVMDDGTTGYGSVAYVYHVSALEVTNGQWAEFLNAVAQESDPNNLYNVGMAGSGVERSGSSGHYTYAPTPGLADRPVVYVTFYDALRLANWLHNGEPIGAQDASTTEDGAYTLTGFFESGPRNPGASIFVASEDEWYKAAYYDPASGAYHDHAAGSDALPTCEPPPGGTNSASCNGAAGLVDVGSYPTSASPFGTLDQGGNVFEWHEGAFIDLNDGTPNGARGGSWVSSPAQLGSWLRSTFFRTKSSGDLGIRVAGFPEPGPLPRCSDGLDNDGDGAVDWPADAACASEMGHNEGPECDNGVDDDGDGDTDHPDDAACAAPGSGFEGPACDDGLDNDGDGRVDWDGGGVGDLDPQCSFDPRDPTEGGKKKCGLGWELVWIVPALARLRRRDLAGSVGR